MDAKSRITTLFGNPAPPEEKPLPDPSEQQKAILALQLMPGQSAKVDAKAGSGKTTSMILFSRAQGPRARILYICFNNKGASEALEKYRKAGIRNTDVSTVHGLAKRVKARYEAAGKFQTKISVKDIRNQDGRLDYKQAWGVLETIKAFCESDKEKITTEHVPLACGKNPQEEASVLSAAQRFWGKMVDLKDKTPISYDHYLKIFELENPKLNYDYILVDECQDSNPITLSIVKKQAQHTRMLLIGDPYQAIYKWRGAKNAMQEWPADKVLPLSESFRFGPAIAAAANTILKVFSDPNEVIVGKRSSSSLGIVRYEEKHTLIARTNASLFEAALEQVARGGKYHFVGTEAKDGWDPSVPYRFNDAIDVFRLRLGDKQGVKNQHIRAFKDYEELKQAAVGINGLGDKELESLCRVVEKYPHTLPALIQKVVQNCTGPKDADMLLVTCHRAKGLEWPVVKMADDFAELVITDEDTQEDRLAVPGNLDNPLESPDVDQEEINLIYVAITRAVEKLEINPRCRELFLRRDLLPDSVLKDPEYQKYLGPKPALRPAVSQSRMQFPEME